MVSLQNLPGQALHMDIETNGHHWLCGSVHGKLLKLPGTQSVLLMRATYQLRCMSARPDQKAWRCSLSFLDWQFIPGGVGKDSCLASQLTLPRGTAHLWGERYFLLQPGHQRPIAPASASLLHRRRSDSKLFLMRGARAITCLGLVID